MEMLEREMQDLIEKSQKFMYRLIKENKALKNEINEYKENFQKLENIDKTNRDYIYKLEKENLQLKEEVRGFALKLKMAEISVAKEENVSEKLESEEIYLQDNQDKHKIRRKLDEVSLCLEKIKELIIHDRYNEAERLFKNKAELIMNSKESFSEENSILIIYLAFYNNLLESFINKNNELFAYYNSDQYEAKALNILKEEGNLNLGDSLNQCYQSYVNSKRDIFSKVNPIIRRYILTKNLHYSYRYYDTVNIVSKLLNKNRYKSAKAFIRKKGKYYLASIFETMELGNKEAYLIKNTYNGYFSEVNKEVNKKDKKKTKGLSGSYENIIDLYNEGDLQEVKRIIERFLDSPLDMAKLKLNEVKLLLFIGNIVGVDKYKIERGFKFNTLKTSFENIVYAN